MRPGSEGAPRVDHERVRVFRRLRPRRSDPEPAYADSAVELLPARFPVGRDLARHYGAEVLAGAALAVCIRVGAELELVATVRLLETFRKERQHPCSGLLGGRAPDADGNPSQLGQRKTLFSFSKNPSSAR